MPDDIGARRAQDFHRLGKSFARDEPPLFAHRQRGHDRDVAQVLKDIQRQQQFIQRGKGLQENQVAAAIEQRADLLAEKGLAVIDRKFAVGGTQRKRPDRSADENIAAPLTASRATWAARQLISPT